jgi:signal transduction histidine kinase
MNRYKMDKENENKGARPFRQTLLIYALRTAFALSAASLLMQFEFHYLESFFLDQRSHWSVSPQFSDQIRIINIDSKTVEKFKKIPDLSLHAEMLKKLKLAQPKAVVYVSNFTTFEGSKVDKARFKSLALEFPNFMLQSEEMELKGEAGSKLTMPTEFEGLKLVSGPKTADRTILAKDGVTRRVIYSYQDQVLMQAQLAALVKPELLQESNISGLLDLFDSKQIFIRWQKAGRFPTVRFEDLIEGQISSDFFTNKIVLIGDDLGQNLKGYITAPFNVSGSSPLMTNTEYHANAIETFIKNSAPIQASRWVNWLLTSLISILTIHVVLSLRPLKGLQILVGAAAGFILLAWLLFWLCDLWIIMTQPLLAIFLCYYFFIPYRLIIENRKSWEYFEKNKILKQVEVLKSNFISMMSHDLKTPIARIQGMTDVILKDQAPLSSTQRDAIDTIRFSAQDLLTIINSILSYAKIESQGVQLMKQAKDINVLITDVVKRHDFMARVKHMKITTELEPLFSVLVDPDVLKQVFSNLLENAIKYSPENSEVKVISRESSDGFIEVQFIDQGPGIAEDELSQVFMKFFRSRNAKASPVKGSGLGLYLAKYFVELHHGQINVQSFPGNGSAFTVKLPINNAQH